MSRRLLLAALLSVAAGAPSAQTAPLDGKALFHQRCEMCHGPGGITTSRPQSLVVFSP